MDSNEYNETEVRIMKRNWKRRPGFSMAEQTGRGVRSIIPFADGDEGIMRARDLAVSQPKDISEEQARDFEKQTEKNLEILSKCNLL